MYELIKVAVQWWPLLLSLLTTFMFVHSVKFCFKSMPPIKRRMYTRGAAFIIGFTFTYLALSSFADIGRDRNITASLFVGLGNPSLYTAFMWYLKIKKPKTYYKLSSILKHHAS